MKRVLISVLIFSLLLLCAGCGSPDENSCTFYYLRTADTIRYGADNPLIAPITLEISDESPQLNYLLQLYLDGPAKKDYYNPIPKGTYLLSTLWDEDVLVLVLSREFSTLENMHLTLAGACLTATCHALTGAEKIQVRSADTVFDFDLNNYVFTDTSTGD